MAAGDLISNKATPITNAASAAVSSQPRGAIVMLRLLLLALVIAPPVLGGAAGYVSYQHSYDSATDALFTAAANASKHTAATLDKYLLIAARINDLLGAMNPAQIHAHEREFHDAMGRQIADMPEVAAAWVIDATGRALVSARIYPINRDLDQSGREDYRAIRDTDARTFIWILRARNLVNANPETYVTVSVRRTSLSGRFDGVVIVAVAGSYFTSFYKSLVASPDYIVDLVKTDGTILAQFPAQESTGAFQLPDPLLEKALAVEGETGVADRGTPFDRAGRIVAIARIADYPIYVAVELSKASMRNEWLRSIADVVAISIASMIVSIPLTKMALRRAHRETTALARAAEAFSHRAALEVQVHRMQRLAGVALLTTGMAREFSRLLTNVQDNIQRLEAAIKDVDAGEQSSIAALRESSDRGAMLIKRLLGYAWREPVKPQPIDINETIAHALEQSRQFADPIPSEVRLQKGLWLSCIDPDQLTIALLNLMFNARDVFSETPKLIIETMNIRVDKSDIAGPQEGKPGEYVGLLIESPEPEISLEADNTFAPAGPGKGSWPSLALLHELAQSVGGYWLVSSKPTHETTIRVCFPRYLSDLNKAEHNPISNKSDTVHSLK
jgi:two-component system NtrC family sensor kinase